jgi:4-hydroxybenzoate polyprenyltransferase
MMKLKELLFNSITISLPKNVVQFSLGVILFWFLMDMPDVYTTLFSLAGFLVAYSSVYLYNDVVDCNEDKKDREKIKWKIVAGGMLSATQAKTLTVVFASTGLFLSFMVNKWFFLIILAMLLLNFLHSSPQTKFKKSMRKTAVNMTAIEFLKYSCGWFALTTDISRFPFWMMMTFAVVYMASYLIYKFKFKGSIIKSNKKMFLAIGIFGGLSYFVSFIQYGFPLSMTLLVVIPLSILLFLKQIEIEFHRINNMIIIEYLLLPLVIISFVILMVPVVGQANENMVTTIGTYKEMAIKEMPEDIKKSVDNITDELKKYRTIEDIENGIKTNIENISRPNGSN